MTVSKENRSGLNSSKPIKSGPSKARSYRMLAAECSRQAELAFEEPQFRAMQIKLARSYVALAEAEEWLDGQTPAQRLIPEAERNEAQAA